MISRSWMTGSVNVIYYSGTKAYTCKCHKESEKAAPPVEPSEDQSAAPTSSQFIHSPTCRCTCEFCNNQRNCPCLLWNDCDCSEFCNPCSGWGWCQCAKHRDCICPPLCKCVCQHCCPARNPLRGLKQKVKAQKVVKRKRNNPRAPTPSKRQRTPQPGTSNEQLIGIAWKRVVSFKRL